MAVFLIFCKLILKVELMAACSRIQIPKFDETTEKVLLMAQTEQSS
jgi:hypothetical protein